MTDALEKRKIVKKRKSLDERRNDICVAAMEILSERGFEGTTMSAIAKRANISKETLYGVCASKEALFADIVSLNSLRLNKEIVDALSEENGERRLIPDVLVCFGEKLFTLLTSDESIVLNRIAIASLPLNTQFSSILTQKGRGATLPLLKEMMKKASIRGELPASIPENAEDIFIGLLIGDFQIKRLLAVEDVPTQDTIKTHAKKSVELFVSLMNAMQGIE